MYLLWGFSAKFKSLDVNSIQFKRKQAEMFFSQCLTSFLSKVARNLCVLNMFVLDYSYPTSNKSHQVNSVH